METSRLRSGTRCRAQRCRGRTRTRPQGRAAGSCSPRSAKRGRAVSSAAVPWADQNQARRPGGWQLFVEVIKAEAEHDGARMIVTIGVRATLRARVGGAHIAQTETGCRDAGLVAADEAAPVLYGCMTRIGRDLTSWLAAADPVERPKAAGKYTMPEGGVVGAYGADADTDGDGDSDAPGESD